MPLEGHVQPVGEGPAGPVLTSPDGGITTGTTEIGLEITVVLTEPELLVDVEEVLDATPGRPAVATVEALEPERPSKRIV
ncbi:hypothetical protein CFII64_03927 [Pseudomonas sp. CFII64]|nr:hypothetical protein CFII64_03927 [Pseudomonas sp. CFII64]